MESRTNKPVKIPEKAKTMDKKPVATKPRTKPKTNPQLKFVAKTSTKAAIKPKPQARAKVKTPVRTAAPATPVSKSTTTRKQAPVKKPAAPRESLATMLAHIDALETRLKRASSMTQSSVKAMQTAFTKLNERSEKASASQESEIVEYVEALNVHLTGLIDKTREDVAHDLQIVLEDPRVETLSDALTKANHRITRAESDQAAALTTINEQIANLATIVDRRLRRETEERERTEHVLTGEIEEVEKSSAKAVSSIGEKIVALAEELNNRTDHSIAAFKRELADTSQNHQKDIEEHKSEIGRRIEELEDDQRNTIPSIERRMVTMVSRLEALEAHRFNEVSTPQLMAPAYEPAPQFEASVVATASAPILDAFTPQPAVAYEAISPPRQIMQLQDPQTVQMPSTAIAMATALAPSLTQDPIASHIPQEYVPPIYPAQEPAAPEYPTPIHQTQEIIGQEYTAPTYAPPETGQTPDVYANNAYDRAQPPKMGNPAAQSGTQPPPPFTSDIPLMPPLEQTTHDARPGGDILPTKKGGILQKFTGGASSSALSGSPVKLFALMTGIAVIGLFAVPKIMSGPKASNPQGEVPRIVSIAPAALEFGINPAFASAAPTTPAIETMNAVGDYFDTMQAPEIEPESNGVPSPAQLTLESAASNGDKVPNSN